MPEGYVPKVYKDLGGDRLTIAEGGWLRFLGGKITGLTAGRGRIYFVNTAANGGSNSPDSGDGMDPAHPLLTITNALSRCTDGYNDIIMVLDYWQASGETWPIAVNVKQVHIMGLALPGLPYPTIHPTGDTAAFQLGSSGQYGSISRLTIGGGDTHGGIDWGNAGQVDGFEIVENTFGSAWFDTPANGILQPASASRGGYGCRIVGNTFLGDLASCNGAITGNAIELLKTTDATAFRDLVIKDNVFKGCYTGVNGVRLLDAVIEDNRFIVADAVTGEAVNLGTNSNGCLVAKNLALNGMLNTGWTFNPFRDLAAHPANHWGRNFRTNQVIEPVGI